MAASIGELANVLRGACAVQHSPIPARGQRSLALDVGVTGGEASVTCDLRFRNPRRFAQADRIAAFCWIKSGEFDVRFRLRDARGQVFETTPQPVRAPNRWLRIVAELDAKHLRRVHGDGPLTWPIEVVGYRATTSRLGKQTLFLDDLEIEHRVEPRQMLAGEFLFDEPTRIYEPGSTVRAALKLENCSRQHTLPIFVELAWTRPDESVLRTHRANLTLPPSGRDFRSRGSLDFSQRIDAPGLYHLTARARAAGWITPTLFQTSIAVTPSNRLLPRGRAAFFGVRSDLLHEPLADQQLEIAVARDIGVHLLALDTPWRLIQPARDRLDLARLDAIVDTLLAGQIAPLLILTQPPEWVPDGPARLDRVADTLSQLIAHYGPRVSRYQLALDALGVSEWPVVADALQQVRERLPAGAAAVELISPTLSLDSPLAADLRIDRLSDQPGLQWAFGTRGAPSPAIRTLEQSRGRLGLSWQPSHYWFHDAPPLAGPSFFVDAEAVLHYYVHAAIAGVGHVVWYDLRDNDNDPRNLDALRGLVRRDFSPKASLQGFASAAGMLTGLACRGPVLGTPAEFQSALFVGSDRQTIVLLPKPNRMYPAVLCAFQGAPGRLEARDFERRPHSVLTTVSPPLLPTLSRPLFLTLHLDHPQPEPQLAFIEPWLRAPATAFCDAEQVTTIELRAPVDVRRGSLWLRLPPDAPVVAQPTSRTFTAQAGEKLAFSFAFASREDQPFDEAHATLRLSLDGRTTDVPIQIRPLTTIAPFSGTPERLLDPTRRLAELRPVDGQEAPAKVVVYAGYEPACLHLLFELQDRRLVPAVVTPDGRIQGDDLVFGVAAEGADHHAELRVAMSPPAARLVPAHLPLPEDFEQAQCQQLSCGDPDTYRFHVRLPSRALGQDRLSAGLRLLLAVRYQDDDADGFPPTIMRWGGGLDGSRSAESFRWVQLIDEHSGR